MIIRSLLPARTLKKKSKNYKHAVMKFTCKEKFDNRLHLDVLLNRDENGSISRNVYRKCSSKTVHHFLSFALIHYKRNLVNCLTYRARRICSVDTITKELELMLNMLIETSYPQGVQKKRLRVINKKIATSSVSKVLLFLKLTFNGNVAGDVLRNVLTRTVRRTFNAANFCPSYSTRLMVNPQLMGKLSGLSTNSAADVEKAILDAQPEDLTKVLGNTSLRG